MAGRRPSPADLRIADRVRNLREAAGLTTTACGDALGVTWQQFYKYETGANRLTGGMLVTLAELFRVPVARLFEPAIDVPMPEGVAVALRAAAAARGLSVPEVTRRLLAAAARDGLVDAILDDDAPVRPRRHLREAA